MPRTRRADGEVSPPGALPRSTDNSPINLDTIAERLKLSKGTVSRALRNQPGIHPETRSLVMHTAAEMGYRPLRTRKRVASAEHRFVGVFVHTMRHELKRAQFLSGMAEVAPELNISLVLQPFTTEAIRSITDPSRQPPVLREGYLSGVVLAFHWPDETVRYLSERYPCVSLVHRFPEAPVDVVGMDHHGGMRHIVRHLRDLGHRNIGFFGQNPSLYWANARCAGYLQALLEFGLPYAPRNIIEADADLLQDREGTGARWPFQEVVAQTRRGVTAWVAPSDWAAYELLRELQRRGLRVPHDVSVTGFDNREAQPDDAPLLTSTSIAPEQIGSEALRRLAYRFNTPHARPVHLMLDCSFAPGATTAPPQP